MKKLLATAAILTGLVSYGAMASTSAQAHNIHKKETSSVNHNLDKTHHTHQKTPTPKVNK
ncbi:hypothetical protein [Proteus myxofaciens]|uniref:Secreted protein n=1 Tax=Proteus myxofaciens ATCC 19692 TaxID=1354337 RepID=A0A198GHX1_9GAMM|nr:hypothetical protein [Proteus myxofaciens]OAT36708.1 hypothetical protein M983_0457 [Proteus myxofaciens ATCC 19692]